MPKRDLELYIKYIGANQKITVTDRNSNQRLDKFLSREFVLYTRGEIIRAIKTRGVLVNSKIAKPSYVLKVGDDIEIGKIKEKEELAPNEKIKLEVTYQDKNIIAINKQAGIFVHPTSKESSNTLVNGLIARFPRIKNIGDGSKEAWARPGIVHRLDKDTSGIMVIARNQSAFDKLKNLFQDRKINKQYLAVVYGKLPQKEGVIEKSIARAGNYRKQVIAGRKTKTKIRPAVTEYRVIREGKKYSLVEARPRTGRMHQIRVHLASIGNPVIGDKMYGLKNKEIFKDIIRHLLHAKSLKFELDGKKYFLEATVPEYFREFEKKYV